MELKNELGAIYYNYFSAVAGQSERLEDQKGESNYCQIYCKIPSDTEIQEHIDVFTKADTMTSAYCWYRFPENERAEQYIKGSY